MHTDISDSAAADDGASKGPGDGAAKGNGTPDPNGGAGGHGPRACTPTVPRWRLSTAQWVWVGILLVGVLGAALSYQVLNAAPPTWRWPTFWPYDPTSGQTLNQPFGSFDPGQPAASAPTASPGVALADATTHTFVLRSWLDAKIPFVPLLAVPYLTFLVLVVVVPMLNAWLSSFRRFVTVALALIVSQLVLDVAYVLFQTEVLRDAEARATVERGGFGASLVELVWGNDAPFNGYPSGHVTWTTVLILALWRLRRVIPKTAWILMAWLMLVYPATVMLRQHYLMDVYAGLFVGFATYWACMFAVERPRLVPRTGDPVGWPGGDGG